MIYHEATISQFKSHSTIAVISFMLTINRPSNVTRFDFELKESYDLSTNLEKLPQILDNLAERVASVRDEVVKSPLLK